MNVLKIYDVKENLIAMYCGCPWIWDKKHNKIIISDIINGERVSYDCKKIFTSDNIAFYIYEKE